MLFVSNSPSGEADAATADSGGEDSGRDEVGADDSPQPARKPVVTRHSSHNRNPYRMTISL